MAILIAFVLLLSASTIFAFGWGGHSERAAAAVMLLGVTASPLAAHTGSRLWHGPETDILIVDSTALIAFGAIMLRSNRFWPIWTTAFQLLTVAAHLGPMFRLAKSLAIPFALEEQVWAWVILLQLILVTWLNRPQTPLPH